MGSVLVSIGDQIEPGRYELHSCFEHACNFKRGERLVCVVDKSVGAGPLNIVLTHCREVFACSLEVGYHTVILGDLHFPFSEGDRYHSAVRVLFFDEQRFRRNLACFGNGLARMAPAGSLAFLVDKSRTAQLPPGFARRFAREIARSADEVFHGDLLAGIAGLKGCGPGLTPSGDDFLAGVLIGSHVVQYIWQGNFDEIRGRIFAAALGDNLFSNNFLEMARRGQVSEHVQKLIVALVAGGAGEVKAATRTLMAIGSTSGADFATGLYLTLRDQGEFAARRARALSMVAAEAEVSAWS